jgi:site-specific recombinase XerD
MLEQFFPQPKVLRRLQEGVFGPYLPAFAASLQQEGYSKGCIRHHLRAADQFGAWLSQQKLALSDLTRALVERYIKARGRLYSASRPKGGLPHNAQGLHELMAFLHLQGVIAPAAAVPLTSAGQWLARFDAHLERTLGCAPRSRRNYLRYARRLLEERFGDAEIEWQSLSADAVVEFVRREAAKLQPVSCGQPVTAIRAFLRFLSSAGAVPAGLVGAVPTVRTWRHAALPRAVSAEAVERILAAADPTSAYGLRERAITLLLARLGLRASEVIRLRIDDLDWSQGCVPIRAGKTQRERSLPLCQVVGDALVAYLKKARPTSSHRELFLRWRPPFRPLRSSVSICALIQKLLRRAGVSVHRPGAHVLRHSLATQMVIGGGTFKEIADVLGHQSLATTEIYAKLDLGLLSQVAMPWPGGNS